MVCLVFAAVFLTASVAPQPARPAPPAQPLQSAQPARPAQPPHLALRVVQLNLCGSGMAGCYTGESVSAAAGVIRARMPDVVTLNEVCRDDVDDLAEALTATFRIGRVVSAFTALTDYETGREVRCTTGEPYGIGVLVHVPASSPPHLTIRGVYPAQDPDDSERRAWLCVDPLVGFVACTTHLAATSADVALAQCDHLLRTAIPSVRGTDGDGDPVVLAGDLNLRDGRRPDLRPCLLAGYPHAGDGHVQHVVSTPDAVIVSTELIDMGGTTDHPGLLGTLRIR